MSTKTEQKVLDSQGARLQYFMDLKSIKSQQQLADNIDVSKSAVNRVMTNSGNFKIENYIKLFELYTLSPNWLILGIKPMYLGDKEPAAITNSSQISPELIEATRKIAREEFNSMMKDFQK